MGGAGMRYKWKVSVLGAGAVVTLLLGSGMFSLTLDTVASQGNSAESGTFAAAHDIKAAKVEPGGCPSTTAYSDGPIAAAISTPVGTPNVTLPSTPNMLQADDFCIKNFGTQQAMVSVAFLAFVEKEVGTCEASESDSSQGADTSCAANDQGELASVLFARFNPSAGSSGSCAGTAAETPFRDYNAAAQIMDVDLAPGEVCSVYLQLTTNDGLTTNEKLAAQTDRIEWSIVFIANDTI